MIPHYQLSVTVERITGHPVELIVANPRDIEFIVNFLLRIMIKFRGSFRAAKIFIRILQRYLTSFISFQRYFLTDLKNLDDLKNVVLGFLIICHTWCLGLIL